MALNLALGQSENAPPTTALHISEFLASNQSGLRDDQESRSDWIELYNPTDGAINLGGYALTDDPDVPRKWVLPERRLAARTAQIIFAIGTDSEPPQNNSTGPLYAPFKLSAAGEYLALVAPDGSTVHEFAPSFPPQKADISFGLTPAGQTGYFDRPSPGRVNSATLQEGFLPPLFLSHQRGFYQQPVLLRLASSTDGAAIRYTLDGSRPSPTHGTFYRSPIPIETTTILRLISFKSQFIASDVQTHTFLFFKDVAHQPAQPEGYPNTWGTDNEIPGGNVDADYEMDSRVINGAQPGFELSDALLDLPTLSVALAPDDFVGRSRGIYTHPKSRGAAWEKECSIEWMEPSGTRAFQSNCQIEIHGNSSRRPWRMQKHSFRLTFLAAFGNARLNFPIFPDSPVDRFNKLILRASFTDSWGLVSWSSNRYRPNDSQYIRDVWMKESFRDMGHPSSHGDWVHLYVNGLYWGIYNVTERLDADFFSDHQGGDPDDWEIIEDLGGTSPGWASLFSLIRSQNQAPDLLDQIAPLLDVNNFIDYMLLHFYADAEDWPHHNGYAAHNPHINQPFRFLVWDQEIVLDNPRLQRYGNNEANKPGALFQLLRQNQTFRDRFGDRVHFHLFGAGGLNLPHSQERYARVAQRIDKAIVAESARWGDTQQSTSYGNRIQQPANPNNRDDLQYPPAPNAPDVYFTREDSWLVEKDTVIEHYLPRIYDASQSQSLIRELRTQRLYPAVDAPRITPPSGAYTDLTIELTQPNGGAIYFTTDGTDPRSAERSANDGIRWIDANTPVFVHIPTANSPARTWVRPEFDHSGWTQGRLGVGYETAPADFEGLIRSDVSAMRNQTASVYLRIPFELTAKEITDSRQISLNMRYDDGFVVFLNGVRVADANAPGTLRWNTTATASHNDAAAIQPVSFDLTEHRAQLEPGTNLLAIQGLNHATTSTDLLLLPELSATSIGNQPTEASIAGMPYAGPIQLDRSATLKARTFANGEWSALNEARFFIGETATQANLIISEIHYHPAQNGDAEYLRIQNINPLHPIDLSRLRFEEGIQYEFLDGASLAPGKSALLVRSEESYLAEYGDSEMILGQYSGVLDNGGESLHLVDRQGQTIVQFRYDDELPWPPTADGHGASLGLLRPDSAPDPANSQNWQPLSPGTDGSLPDLAQTDRDQDGLNARLEFALGTSDDDPQSGWDAIQLTVEPIEQGQPTPLHFFLRYRTNPIATGIRIQPEQSTHLFPAEWARQTLIPLPPSALTEGWRGYRTEQPIRPDSQSFIRLQTVESNP